MNNRQNNITKETLETSKMKDLFGANYTKILYFDFDNNQWNRSDYLGFSTGNQSTDTVQANKFRNTLQPRLSKFGFEIVATITMAVSDSEYPGTNKSTTNTPSYKRANNIIGTVILRDKATGKILKPNTWMGINKYQMMSTAAFFGANDFMYRICINKQIRDNFIKTILAQRQR